MTTAAAPDAEQEREFTTALLAARSSVEAMLASAFSTLSEQDREDIGEEAVTAAWEAFTLGTEIDSVDGFLVTIARHRAIDLRLQQKCRNTDAHAPDSPAFAWLTTDEEHDVARVVEAQLESERVKAVMPLLPKREQEVLGACFGSELSDQGAIEALGFKDRFALRRVKLKALERLADAMEGRGAWVDIYRSLAVRWIAGEATEQEHEQARALAGSDKRFAQMAWELRTSAKATGYQAIALPAVFATDPGMFERLGQGLGDLRRGALELVTRGGETTAQVSVARAGMGGGGLGLAKILSMVCAGTLVAGGATYCATNGIPEPIKELAGAGTKQATAEKPKPIKVEPLAAGTESLAGASAASSVHTRQVRATRARAALRTRAKRAAIKKTQPSAPVSDSGSAAVTPAPAAPGGEFKQPSLGASGGSAPAQQPAPAQQGGELSKPTFER